MLLSPSPEYFEIHFGSLADDLAPVCRWIPGFQSVLFLGIGQVFSSAVKAGVGAWKPGWIRTCAVLLLGLGLWGSWLSLTTEACPVRELAEEHQDGNDKFYVLTHPAIGRLKPHPTIEELEHPESMLDAERKDEEKGVDAHFLVSVDTFQSYNSYIVALNLFWSIKLK